MSTFHRSYTCNASPHSPGRLSAQEPRRTVAFVELLKHTNEPLGLALEGKLYVRLLNEYTRYSLCVCVLYGCAWCSEIT